MFPLETWVIMRNLKNRQEQSLAKPHEVRHVNSDEVIDVETSGRGQYWQLWEFERYLIQNETDHKSR
jgi:hypothetical protein